MEMLYTGLQLGAAVAVFLLGAGLGYKLFTTKLISVRSARDRTIRTFQIRVRSEFLESKENHEKPLRRSGSPGQSAEAKNTATSELPDKAATRKTEKTETGDDKRELAVGQWK